MDDTQDSHVWTQALTLAVVTQWAKVQWRNTKGGAQNPRALPNAASLAV